MIRKLEMKHWDLIVNSTTETVREAIREGVPRLVGPRVGAHRTTVVRAWRQAS